MSRIRPKGHPSEKKIISSWKLILIIHIYYSYLQNARPFWKFLCVRPCLVQIHHLGNSAADTSRWGCGATSSGELIASCHRLILSLSNGSNISIGPGVMDGLRVKPSADILHGNCSERDSRKLQTIGIKYIIAVPDDKSWCHPGVPAFPKTVVCTKHGRTKGAHTKNSKRPSILQIAGRSKNSIKVLLSSHSHKLKLFLATLKLGRH